MPRAGFVRPITGADIADDADIAASMPLLYIKFLLFIFGLLVHWFISLLVPVLNIMSLPYRKRREVSRLYIIVFRRDAILRVSGHATPALGIVF
jgi:hypothetical protein